MSVVRLGIDNCFAVKRWPQAEVWVRIIAEQLGLDLVQFSFDHLDPLLTSEPARSRICASVRKEVQRQGVEIFATITGSAIYCFNLLSHPDPALRHDGLRWCEEAVLLTTKLGARGISGHFDEFSATDIDDPARRQFLVENVVESLKHLARLAAAEGQEFLIWEQMYFPRSIPYTMRQAQELYEKVNDAAPIPIWLGLDVGHACCHAYPVDSEQDRDVYAWLRRFASVSPVIHIHQTDGVVSRHWPFTEQYNVRGIIEPERVLQAIDEAGASDVILMLEIFHGYGTHEQQVLDDLKASVEYWRRYLP
ncbi:MAG: TIM barrel protein [Chloroflexi bacterium]|nr:TIM barrel protein [Chloroflexota bacterium]